MTLAASHNGTSRPTMTTSAPALAPDWATRVDDHFLLTGDTELRAMVERSGAHLIGWRELRDLQRAG